MGQSQLDLALLLYFGKVFIVFYSVIEGTFLDILMKIRKIKLKKCEKLEYIKFLLLISLNKNILECNFIRPRNFPFYQWINSKAYLYYKSGRSQHFKNFAAPQNLSNIPPIIPYFQIFAPIFTIFQLRVALVTQ